MKNTSIRPLSLLLLALALIQVFPVHAAKTVPLDRIVAVVNKNVILESELNNQMTAIKQQLSGKMELPPDDALRKQVLERLIVERLQLDEADSYGLTIDDTILNEDLRNIASKNGLTLEGLRQRLQNDGVDYETFRQERKKQLLLTRLRQGFIGSRVKVSEAEIDEFLASQDSQDNKSEYLVSHIQISMPEDADRETIQKKREQAEALYERLQKGEDFARMAVAESDGRSALEGGDLGWHKLSELPKQFASELRTMTPGQISKPFRVSSSFNILKLQKTRGIERVIVKQVKARHILMASDKLTTDEEVRQKLDKLRKQILAGADFAALAEKYSLDNGSAANGGDLGWTEPHNYAPQFRKVVENLPVGKISQPFKSKYGWHIVQVLGWRDYDKTADIVRETAYQNLFERKAMIEEDLWVRRLRSEAFVDIRLKD